MTVFDKLTNKTTSYKVITPTESEIQDFINKKFGIDAVVSFGSKELEKEIGFETFHINWKNKLLSFMFYDNHAQFVDLIKEEDYDENAEVVIDRFNKDIIDCLDKYFNEYIDILNYTYKGISVVNGMAKFKFEDKEYLTDNFYIGLPECKQNIILLENEEDQYEIIINPLNGLNDSSYKILDENQLEKKIEQLKKDNIVNIEKKKEIIDKLKGV